MDAWVKKVGDELKVGDVIAHASVGDLIIGVETNFSGILAQTKVIEGETVPTDSEIALVVNDKDGYLKFLEAKLEKLTTPKDASAVNIPPLPQGSAATVAVAEKQTADAADVLREIKVLINQGIVQEESGKLNSWFF